MCCIDTVPYYDNPTFSLTLAARLARFEALVKGKKPEEIWSEEECTMKDGYKLKTLRVPNYGFFSMGYVRAVAIHLGFL